MSDFGSNLSVHFLNLSFFYTICALSLEFITHWEGEGEPNGSISICKNKTFNLRLVIEASTQFMIDFTSNITSQTIRSTTHLILERRPKIVEGHFLMKHRRYRGRHWRHNPYPIGRATIPSIEGSANVKQRFSEGKKPDERNCFPSRAKGLDTPNAKPITLAWFRSRSAS